MNGKRYQSSVSFLHCPESRWALKMMAVCLEGTKVLTHYWLRCLNQSLRPASRPPLYKVLDPRTSVLTQALQYFASMLFNDVGDGRLLSFLMGRQWLCDFQRFLHVHATSCQRSAKNIHVSSCLDFPKAFCILASTPV